ncbi:MAG: hypothetical protein AB3N16_15935 [Flavobacteriaceae bacterium]
MKKTKLKERIIAEIQGLLSQSCDSKKLTKEHSDLHIALLKKYYNAAHVQIDYHRKRITLHLLYDDSDYRPNTVNINIPTLYTNLKFNNLYTFLKNCLERDKNSLGFYAGLIRSMTKREVTPTMA